MGDAREKIRNQGRSAEEAEDYGKMPTPWILRGPRLPPEERRERHNRSTREWQARNLAEGKCQSCTASSCRESTHYCAKHLAAKRDRQRKKLGTIVHGRGQHPNTLAALRKAAETRKPKHISRTKQNSALLKMMRGEETSEE